MERYIVGVKRYHAKVKQLIAKATKELGANDENTKRLEHRLK